VEGENLRIIPISAAEHGELIIGVPAYILTIEI
jgi:hypothetical protein